MEKKIYITPETNVYLIHSSEICEFGAGGSADDSTIFSKGNGNGGSTSNMWEYMDDED